MHSDNSEDACQTEILTLSRFESGTDHVPRQSHRCEAARLRSDLRSRYPRATPRTILLIAKHSSSVPFSYNAVSRVVIWWG